MRRVGKKAKQSPDLALDEHIQRLCLKSRLEYVHWCRKNQLSDQLFKHRKQREREVELACKLARQACHSPARVRCKSPAKMVADLCIGDGSMAALELPYIKHFANQLQAASSCPKSSVEPSSGHQPAIDRGAMAELVQKLDAPKVQYLFEPIVACSRLADSPDNTFLSALALIAAHRQDWLRPLQNWYPSSHNPRRQFSALWHHLFDRHGEVPECFLSAWFQGRSIEANRFRRWSLKIGSGSGLRDCELPIPYTRALWHNLRQAPDRLLVGEALRWAQIRSLGGRIPLAEAAIKTRIGNCFEHSDFWSEVVQWLVEQTMFDPVHVGPVVDYLHEQRFVPVLLDNRQPFLGRTAPRQPNLTMKGRSAETLLKCVHQWHDSLGYQHADSQLSWPASGILPLVYEQGERSKPNYRLWRIRELLNKAALIAEGRKLRHCVASYAASCLRGETSIWTLEVEAGGCVEKLLTLEVRPRLKQIIQARGRCNRLCTEQERAVLQRWAMSAGLKIAI